MHRLFSCQSPLHMRLLTLSVLLTGVTLVAIHYSAYTASHFRTPIQYRLTPGGHVVAVLQNTWATRVDLVHISGTYDLRDEFFSQSVAQTDLPSWASAIGDFQRGGRYTTFAVTAHGWPLRAFTCKWLSPALGNRANPIRLSGGIKLRQPAIPLRAAHSWGEVPLTPQPLALVTNLIAYFILWMLLLQCSIYIHRWWRRSREQCMTCGYDLRGQAIRCPECGNAIGRRPKLRNRVRQAHTSNSRH
jgi:predicted RNA-binding Zn-ribbon protein involved in translation (DUF1610 family)